MLRFSAKVTWFPRDPNVPRFRYFEGCKPQIAVDGDLLSCKVAIRDSKEAVPYPRDALADLMLPYGERYETTVVAGFRFNIHATSEVIGSGVVISVDEIKRGVFY